MAQMILAYIITILIAVLVFILCYVSDEIGDITIFEKLGEKIQKTVIRSGEKLDKLKKKLKKKSEEKKENGISILQYSELPEISANRKNDITDDLTSFEDLRHNDIFSYKGKKYIYKEKYVEKQAKRILQGAANVVCELEDKILVGGNKGHIAIAKRRPDGDFAVFHHKIDGADRVTAICDVGPNFLVGDATGQLFYCSFEKGEIHVIWVKECQTRITSIVVYNKQLVAIAGFDELRMLSMNQPTLEKIELPEEMLFPKLMVVNNEGLYIVAGKNLYRYDIYDCVIVKAAKKIYNLQEKHLHDTYMNSYSNNISLITASDQGVKRFLISGVNDGYTSSIINGKIYAIAYREELDERLGYSVYLGSDDRVFTTYDCDIAMEYYLPGIGSVNNIVKYKEGIILGTNKGLYFMEE